MLRSKEKQEFLRLSKSSALSRDLKKIRENRARLMNTRKRKIDLDGYIKFLTISNEFANHKRKSFKKIEGDHFKL